MCNSRSSLVNIHFYRIWKPSEGYPFSTKLVPRDHHAVVTRFLHFKVKTKNGKRKFKRTLGFLFVDEEKLFIKKSSFEEFNLVFSRRNAWSVLNATKAAIFRYILHPMAKKITFLKGNLCMYIVTFFSSAQKKNYKMRPDLRWILC